MWNYSIAASFSIQRTNKISNKWYKYATYINIEIYVIYRQIRREKWCISIFFLFQPIHVKAPDLWLPPAYLQCTPHVSVLIGVNAMDPNLILHRFCNCLLIPLDIKFQRRRFVWVTGGALWFDPQDQSINSFHSVACGIVQYYYCLWINAYVGNHTADFLIHNISLMFPTTLYWVSLRGYT